jgi:hypothetical protein
MKRLGTDKEVRQSKTALAVFFRFLGRCGQAWNNQADPSELADDTVEDLRLNQGDLEEFISG